MTSPLPVTRVAVAEDNRLVRLGIVALLKTQSDLVLAGEAEDGAQAVNLFRAARPDVFLIDLRMPILDGVQVTREILRSDPEARLLVLSHYDGEEDIFRAVQAGARGYLTKEHPPEEILDAIRVVRAGGRYLPSNVAERLNERKMQPELTLREHQVLELLALGLTNKQIGDELCLAHKTCSIHVSAVLGKLGAHTRTEAVAIAQKRGLLKPPASREGRRV
jgi:two-component system NarL family response regulator